MNQHPLRDWSRSRFQQLDQATLERLLSYVGIDKRDIVDGPSKKNIATEVFMQAHKFGTFTLEDIVTKPDVAVEDPGDPEYFIFVPVCQWFALCDNPATTTRSHPVLGDVPICDRCKEALS